MKIKRNPRGSLLDGLLSIRGFTQVTLRCVAGDEVTRVLKEVHSRDFEHKGDSMLFNRSFILVVIVPPRNLMLFLLLVDVGHASPIVTESMRQHLIA